MQRDDRIENADRILCGDLGELVDLIVVRVICGDAVRFAHAVDHDDQALVPAGSVVRAGRMRQVMIHLMNLVGGKAGEMLLHFGEQLFARENLFVLLGGRGVEHERSAIRRVVEAVRDFVDVADLDAGGIEAVLDRVDREIAGVLFAAEALFGGAGDDFAVDQQDGGRIVALRNAIFALFESRPMRLFLNGIEFSNPLIPSTFAMVKHLPYVYAHSQGA